MIKTIRRKKGGLLSSKEENSKGKINLHKEFGK